MKYWFVNLGQFYKEQHDGNFLWAPLKTLNGGRKTYWESLEKVSKGDLIFCNNHGKIMSIAVAKDSAYIFDIPESFENTWENKGRRINVNFIDIKPFLKFNEYKDYYLNEIDSNENPFDINGDAKQGYLFPLDEKIAKYFLKIINNLEINNIVELFNENIIDELNDLAEEEEQFEKINHGAIIGYSDEELSRIESQIFNYVPNYSNGKKKEVRLKTDSKIKATRLERSNYQCEIDCRHLTFTNSSGKRQYMECHHIIPMNAQKEYPNIKLDSMFNVISLCPICHSQVHYGDNVAKAKVFKAMYEKRKDEMIKYGFDLSKINEVFNKYYLNNKN